MFQNGCVTLGISPQYLPTVLIFQTAVPYCSTSSNYNQICHNWALCNVCIFVKPHTRRQCVDMFKCQSDALMSALRTIPAVSVHNTHYPKPNLFIEYPQKWCEEILYIQELWTFSMIKKGYVCQKYVCTLLSKRQRLLCAQLQSEILPPPWHRPLQGGHRGRADLHITMIWMKLKICFTLYFIVLCIMNYVWNYFIGVKTWCRQTYWNKKYWKKSDTTWKDEQKNKRIWV